MSIPIAPQIELIIEQEMGFTSANHCWIVSPDCSFVALGLEIQGQFAELLQEKHFRTRDNNGTTNWFGCEGIAAAFCGWGAGFAWRSRILWTRSWILGAL
jgi:hypothetical protein